jgi:hypothetical protein
MKISNTRNLDSGATAALELKEAQMAVNASSFKLRVTGGKVTSQEISHMLTLARTSKHYKNNAADYQFKLKSDSKGQYLTLKQQGSWSSFKGLFGWGRDSREQQRAEAKNIINSALTLREMPSEGFQDDKYDAKLTHSLAKDYQLSMMNTSAISPTFRHDLSAIGLSGSNKDQSGEAHARVQSENVTMSMLAAGNALVDEEQPMGNPSFQHYDPQEESKNNNQIPQKRASQNVVPNKAHNSYMRPVSQNELQRNSEVNRNTEMDDDLGIDRQSEVNRTSKVNSDFHQFMMGLILKQQY